ncbi:MAG TPA: ice-binding family protein [Gallionellaceae bacterium]|nr:ice-binding family protein [Gallionellaceae bacterium]
MNKFNSSKKPLVWFSAILLSAVVAGCGGQDPILGGGGAGSSNLNLTAISDLGILAPFGIASYGGITNSNAGGTTKINGDGVLNPTYNCNGAAVGSTNDYSACLAPDTPLNNAGDKVVTPIFPDTTTAASVTAALNTKWKSLSPASLPGATVLGCGTIGSAGGGGALIGCAGNATLPPGVYISATGSSIGVSGTLTLNGSATDVWVFQAPSAVTTAIGSTILLTGGAKASNVWWYVGSSASLGGSTTFNGNILASASISMGTLATSCGRLLAGAEGSGAFSFLSNTVSVPGHPNAPAGCQ